MSAWICAPCHVKSATNSLAIRFRPLLLNRGGRPALRRCPPKSDSAMLSAACPKARAYRRFALRSCHMDSSTLKPASTPSICHSSCYSFRRHGGVLSSAMPKQPRSDPAGGFSLPAKPLFCACKSAAFLNLLPAER